MSMYIPLMILGIAFVAGVTGLIIWRIKAGRAEVRRWIKRD
jgi:hypothetical protein